MAASPTTVQVLVTLSRVAVPGMEPGVLAAMRHRPASRGTTQALRRSELPSQPAVPAATTAITICPIANGPAYALYKVQTNQTATDAAKASRKVAVDTAIILV